MMMMILSNNKTMMMKMVKFVYNMPAIIVLFVLLVDLVSSSAVVSSEQNNDIDYQKLRRGMNVVDRQRRGDVDFNGTNNIISSSIIISNTKQNHNNDRSRLLEDLMIEDEKDDLESLNRMMISTASNDTTTSITSTGCVRSQNQFVVAIANVPDNLLIPTTISLCKEFIFIDDTTPNSITGEKGIHIINKFVNIRCIINKNKKCVIDARGKSRHMYIKNSTLLLTRISFINGKETGKNNFDVLGGSLYITTSSNVIMNNVDFISNIAIGNAFGDGGGAIYCDDNNNNIKLVNVNMISNEADDFYGFGGAIISYSNIQMTNVLFTNNIAGTGGAVYSKLGNVSMMNVSFKDNTATLAGGAYAASNNSYVTFVNSTMTNNNAGITGGAIYINEDSYCNIENSLFNRNNAGFAGGAIGSQLSTVLLNEVAFTNNSVVNGTLALDMSKLGLKNVVFLSSILDDNDCDIFIGTGIDYNMVNFELRVSRANLPSSPPSLTQKSFAMIDTYSSTYRQQPLQACVTTYTALWQQIRLCDIQCTINICRSRIQMNNVIGESQAIDLSNKNIVFNCQRNSSKRCMIDGQGASRMFYGSNVNVTFSNMIFANGYSSGSRGVIDLRSGSLANLFNCTFLNNTAATGGAIMINDTTFYMTGTQSSFINNTGSSPPLVGYSSALNMYDTFFEGNSMTEFGNGILLFDSTIELYNTTFSESKNVLDLGCNVFVAADPNDFTNGASCLDAGSAY